MTIFATANLGSDNAPIESLDPNWIRVTSYTGTITSIGGKIQQVTAQGSARYRYNVVPPSANYKVTAGYEFLSLVNSGSMLGINVCVDSASATFYLLELKESGALNIRKRAGGSWASIASTTVDLAAAPTGTFAFERAGTTLSAYFNGVRVIDPVTDTSIAITGFPGVFSETASGAIANTTTGLKITSWVAETLEAGSPDATATGGTGTGTGSGTGGSAIGGSGGTDATATGGTGTGTGSGTGGNAVGSSTGSFTAGPIENNAGSPWLNQPVAWTWTPAGRVGSKVGKTPIDGTGTTHATTGVLVATGLPAGTGQLDIAILGATAADDLVYQEYGTVT